MADLPTPGSPIKRGLFFLRLDNICETRSISFSLPTIGSSLSSSAIFVKSLPKLSNTGVFDFESDDFFEDELLDEKSSSLASSSSSADSGCLASGLISDLYPDSCITSSSYFIES